jgi:diadenosine tetraphosphate (Ap4A) HIT family hydrolase
MYQTRTDYIKESNPDTIEESSAPWDDLAWEDFHVKVFYDKYPCTPGHLLFVPKYIF